MLNHLQIVKVAEGLYQGVAFSLRASELGGSLSVCHGTNSHIHVGEKINMVIE